MTTGNEPQLGGQEHDNAPMISGLGTPIAVSVRWAYETRTLKPLFDALESEQELLFRQIVIREMVELIRLEVEQEALSQPYSSRLDVLREIDNWLYAPTEENYQQLDDRHYHDLHFAQDPISSRLGHLVSAALSSSVMAIETATRTVLDTPPRDIQQQPRWLILYHEIHDWTIDVAWAILNGRNAPPLLVDPMHIEALRADPERWYRKKNLPVLYQLFSNVQRQQFRQVLRHQAMSYIDKVPVQRWSPADQQVIIQARQWLVHGSSITKAKYDEEILPRFRKRGRNNPAVKIVHGLLGIFVAVHDEEYSVFQVPDAEFVLQIVTHTYRISGSGTRQDGKADSRLRAHQWQIEAAYAILTDQPIPPLGDPNATG